MKSYLFCQSNGVTNLNTKKISNNQKVSNKNAFKIKSDSQIRYDSILMHLQVLLLSGLTVFQYLNKITLPKKSLRQLE